MEKLLNEIKRQFLILGQQEGNTRYTDIEVIEVVQQALTELRKRNVSVGLSDLDAEDNNSSVQSSQSSIYSKPITEVGVYTVEDIKKILGIGRSKAYFLMKSGQFPVMKIGKVRLVSQQRFREWMNNGSEI